MITVEPVQESQLHVLRQIAVQSYSETFADHNTEENLQAFLAEAYSQDAMLAEFHQPGSFCCLALDNGKAVGYLRMRYNDEAEQYLGKNSIELQRLYILTEHKGKGAGSALMKVALEYATKRNAEWVWLGVWERNFAAQGFYFSHGFEKFSEHVFQMGTDPQIDWLLKRNLKS